MRLNFALARSGFLAILALMTAVSGYLCYGVYATHIVSVYALPIEFVTRDPSLLQSRDIGAAMAYQVDFVEEHTYGGYTPFQFQAAEGSFLSVCVTGSPSGWEFARIWVNYGYADFPQHNEDCLNLQVARASADLKIAAFFNQSVPGGQPLQVSIASASPTMGCAPLTAYFRSAVSGGVPNYTYQWDFGDGETASGADSSHTYSIPGTYDVRLSVIDSRKPDPATAKSNTILVVVKRINLCHCMRIWFQD